MTAAAAPLGRFLLVLLALSIPFWIVGAVTGAELFPGLPVAALMAFCPLVAAVVLTRRDRGPEGVRALLRRALDARKIRPAIWFVPIVLLMPAIMVLSYATMRALQLPLPQPRFSVPLTVVMIVAFFLAGLGEEMGWSAYLTDRLQARWSALQTAIVLGVVWALWHAVPYVEAHRSVSWIVWHSLGTVGSRVVIVWLYDATARSVFAAVLYHDMLNVSFFTFPNFGSHYDPRVTTPFIVCAAAVIVAAGARRFLRAPDPPADAAARR